MSIWTIPSSQPVVRPGQLQPEYDCNHAGAGHVIEQDDHYLMTYWGANTSDKYSILQARTPIDSPNAWEAVPGALLEHQPETSHNCQGPSFPFLLPVTDDCWLLYWVGWGTWEDGKLPNTMGVAISEDGGKTFQYHQDHPVILNDRPYDYNGAGSLQVLVENGLFRMYYTCIGNYVERPEGVMTGHGDTIPQIGIAYAESRDGITWEKPLDDLVVKPRGFGVDPFEYICSKPAIIKHNGTYILWVNTFGTAYRMHRLTSKDGIHFDWSERIGPDGEFGVGKKEAFDDHQRSYGDMVLYDNIIRCWFTGNGFGACGMGYAEISVPRVGAPRSRK